MKSSVIIDTGFFIAILSEKDQFHEKALKLRKKIDTKKWVTTWPVMTEVCHILTAREAQTAVSRLFVMYERGGFEIFSLSYSHASSLVKLLQKYQDLPMDLADASLVILAEELSCGDIVSTDQRDFDTYKWKSRYPFNNLFSSKK